MSSTDISSNKRHPSSSEEAQEGVVQDHHPLNGSAEKAENSGATLPEIFPKEAIARISKLEQALAQLEKEKKGAEEQYLRSMAEQENFRKRIEARSEVNQQRGLEKLLKKLLPILDSLEQALHSLPDESPETPRSALEEGVKATLKLMQQFFASEGVETVGEIGQPFDPAIHHAMKVDPHAKALPPNHVSTVLQKGYLWREKLLRPALVYLSPTVGSAVDEGTQVAKDHASQSSDPQA